MDRKTAWVKADHLRREIIDVTPSVWTDDNPTTLHPSYRAMAAIFEEEAAQHSGVLYDEVCSYFRKGASNSNDALLALRRMQSTSPFRVLAALQLLRSTLT